MKCNLQDIAAAKYACKPLDAKKAEAARRANDYKVNKIEYFGDKENGLVGLPSHSNITKYLLKPVNGSTKFIDKTPDQVLADLYGMINGLTLA